MPGNIRVRVLAARNLPVMDRASETADAYVELKFSQSAFKTEIYPKSLNPQWNSDWFKFEAEDEELQDEPLQLRVMDYDTYSANDAIGRVYVDLNPLLSRNGPSQFAGWLPIYDTMHGNRGEIQVMVRIDLFTDTNKFKQSSCGVDFFSTPGAPFGCLIGAVHGFVEELIVCEDPEYQWIDKIRTPRASNEARQLLFAKMTGSLRRRIGKKALELGGNAVIGFHQCFDFEGESGIVARGVGTSVTLIKDPGAFPAAPTSPLTAAVSSGGELWHSPVPEHTILESSPIPVTSRSQQANSYHHHNSAYSRSLDFDMNHSDSFVPIPSTRPPRPHLDSMVAVSSLEELVSSSPQTPGTGSVAVPMNSTQKEQQQNGFVNDRRRHSSSSSSSHSGLPARPSSGRAQAAATLENMEFPFFTLQIFPPSFLVSIAGVVCSRSVKLLDKMENTDESDTRDAWWVELRTEIRSHMKALCCNAVVGYREQAIIHDEVCVLSAAGTAALIELPCSLDASGPLNSSLNVSMDKSSWEKEKLGLRIDTGLANSYYHHVSSRQNSAGEVSNCSLVHIPYAESSLPFPVKIQPCHECGRSKVPDMILATIDPPAGLATSGDPKLIQARLVRKKSDTANEAQAKEVSDMLPFVEYELHNQLVAKLMLQGRNAIFGLKLDIAIGENFLFGLATGTAYQLVALPPNPPLKLVGTVPNRHDSKSMEQLTALAQKVRSKKQLQAELSIPTAEGFDRTSASISPREMSAEPNGSVSNGVDLLEEPQLELNKDKHVFVIELDSEIEPELLLEQSLPANVFCSNTLSTGSLASVCAWKQLHFLCRFLRLELEAPEEFTSSKLARRIDKLLRSTFFKYRRQQHVCLSNLTFSINIPEENEVEIILSAMVMIKAGDYTAIRRRNASERSGPLLHSQSVSVTGSSAGGGQTATSAAIAGRRFSAGSRPPQLPSVITSAASIADDESLPLELATAFSSSAGATIFRMDELHAALPKTEKEHSEPPPSTAGAAASARPVTSSAIVHTAGSFSKGSRRQRLGTGSLYAMPAHGHAATTEDLASSFGATGHSSSSSSVRPSSVFLTPLFEWPESTPTLSYMGHYTFFFVRETNTLKELGGLNLFIHVVIAEVLHVVQAHIAAYNGNGMVALSLSQTELLHSPSRNHAQILISICGDIVSSTNQ